MELNDKMRTLLLEPTWIIPSSFFFIPTFSDSLQVSITSQWGRFCLTICDGLGNLKH